MRIFLDEIDTYKKDIKAKLLAIQNIIPIQYQQRFRVEIKEIYFIWHNTNLTIIDNNFYNYKMKGIQDSDLEISSCNMRSFGEILELVDFIRFLQKNQEVQDLFDLIKAREVLNKERYEVSKQIIDKVKNDLIGQKHWFIGAYFLDDYEQLYKIEKFNPDNFIIVHHYSKKPESKNYNESIFSNIALSPDIQAHYNRKDKIARIYSKL